MSEFVFRGGTVVTPGGPVAADVHVVDGMIAAVGANLDAGGEDLDCSGCWVGPGLVDMHVHLREPGHEWKETIASGSAAAAAGGFTAVVAMPNTDPTVDSGHLATHLASKGAQVGLADIIAAGALTMGRKGERLAHLDEMIASGVRLFTDDGDTVVDAGLLRRAMEYLGEVGGLVAQHAEDPSLSAGGHIHEGAVSSMLGMSGSPAEAEETIVARDLALVRLTGARYHVQHVSTAGTVEMVRSAKAEGLAVTAEVTPHHLTFDHEAAANTDSNMKMFPPLRTAVDVAAVREGLIDGTIDAVATDHAPHAAHEKDVPFEEAPRGVIGLETAIGGVIGAIGPEPMLLFDRMAVRPASILGLDDHGLLLSKGNPANLTVVDPNLSYVADAFASSSRNSPFLGMTMQGGARFTMLRGELTATHGKPA